VESIPFLSLEYQHSLLRSQVEDAFQEVLSVNKFILGARLAAFETEFASYCGTTHCVGVGNGLDALTFALQALALKTGDEVIVPAHTYIATWLAVSRTKATLVPVDAEPNTFNIDSQRLEQVINQNTKVIIPVHMYGQACNMTAIDLIAGKHHLLIVEDNAQAHGALWLQKRTGSFGVINATSFYPTKNLGALGDGGAITTNDGDLAAYVRRNRNYGMETKNVTVDHGVNSRLDEIQAAILSLKLEKLDQWNDMRREIARLYLEYLHGVGDLQLPLSDKEAHHVYHLFVVRTSARDRLRQHLLDNGIETMIHYPNPPHLQPVYSDLGWARGSFPTAEEIAGNALSLPLWPGMTEGQVAHVVENIRQFYG
jgi:dTDP-4-amino-4,6-dideoxygalactose transaminase